MVDGMLGKIQPTGAEENGSYTGAGGDGEQGEDKSLHEEVYPGDFCKKG